MHPGVRGEASQPAASLRDTYRSANASYYGRAVRRTDHRNRSTAGFSVTEVLYYRQRPLVPVGLSRVGKLDQHGGGFFGISEGSISGVLRAFAQWCASRLHSIQAPAGYSAAGNTSFPFPRRPACIPNSHPPAFGARSDGSRKSSFRLRCAAGKTVAGTCAIHWCFARSKTTWAGSFHETPPARRC
jgi:hypothetical protein